MHLGGSYNGICTFDDLSVGRNKIPNKYQPSKHIPWPKKLSNLDHDCWNQHVRFNCFPFIDVNVDAKFS